MEFCNDSGLIPFEAVALDLDGTLLSSRGEISNETSLLLFKLHNSGIHVIIATGRDLPSILCFSKYFPPHYYIVAMNGSIIYEYKDSTLLSLNEDFMKPTALLPIMESLRAVNMKCTLSDTSYTYAYEDSIAFCKADGYVNLRIIEQYSDILRNSSDLAKLSILLHGDGLEQVSVTRNNVNDLLQRFDLTSLNLQVIYTGNYADIVSLTAGKGVAITILSRDFLRISTQNIVSFGDSGNDLCMLKVCGLGIATANASPEAKAAASRVSVWTNDEDSVRRELELLKFQTVK